MYTKAEIFNLALGALLLQRRITDTETDRSNECSVLNTHYAAAFNMALEDMDLDSTCAQVELELLEDMSESVEVNRRWDYGYAYPSDCALFRRIRSAVMTDDRATHINKEIRIYMGQKMILTNEVDAVGEYISNDIEITDLSASAGYAVAMRLATLAAPLITGKGALKLIESIEKKYLMAKAEAQESDRIENFNMVEDHVQSEFVRARIE
jgi:hypothetical protein